MANHEGNHSATDPVDGCYGCELKAKSFHVSAQAAPSRQNKVAPRMAEPNWEKGIAGEYRPGGGFMPYQREDGTTLGIKEYGERKREVDAKVRRLKTDPAVFNREGK